MQCRRETICVMVKQYLLTARRKTSVRVPIQSKNTYLRRIKRKPWLDVSRCLTPLCIFIDAKLYSLLRIDLPSCSARHITYLLNLDTRRSRCSQASDALTETLAFETVSYWSKSVIRIENIANTRRSSAGIFFISGKSLYASVKALRFAMFTHTKQLRFLISLHVKQIRRT